MSADPTMRAGVPPSGRRARAERIYGVLLRAYPVGFRAEYGREMTQLFRDQCRDGDVGTLAFWLTVVGDVARSAPALRVESWRARGRGETRILGGTMKVIAILAVLLGLFDALGAVGEGAAGMRGGVETSYMLSVALGVIAGALLLVAGVAALRGTPSARRTAVYVAIASLTVFLLARFTHPWMSIFSQLVGFVLPLVVLAALQWNQRRPAPV